MSQSSKTTDSSIETDFKHLISFVKTLRVEGLSLAALMVVLTYKTNQSLWFLAATFLLFDVSMVGYLFNEKMGALFYNIGHNSVLPTLLLIVGLLGNNRGIQVWAFAWLFHIGIDRTLGYGLKHKTSFKHTHLGKL